MDELRCFLLQMAGTPGSGKSTLAMAIGWAVGAVVIDHDVVKSAVLSAGVPWDRAGPAAYQSDFALARDLLAQGYSVILDSACHYPDIPEKGANIASEAAVPYLFIECLCADDAELIRRREGRPRRRSQMAAANRFSADAADYAPSEAEPIDDLRWRTHRPAAGCIEVDMTGSVEDALERSLAYIELATR